MANNRDINDVSLFTKNTKGKTIIDIKMEMQLSHNFDTVPKTSLTVVNEFKSLCIHT